MPFVQYGTGVDPENNLAGRTRMAGIAVDEVLLLVAMVTVKVQNQAYMQ